MNVHFFNFTSLPDLIVRKNYTRKQYETLVKLLLSIKDSYLKERSKTEAENVDEEGKESKPKSDSNVITEEDMVEI